MREVGVEARKGGGAGGKDGGREEWRKRQKFTVQGGRERGIYLQYLLY